MEIIQAVTLAFLQGLTEFLPISSSAHLILLPVIVGWEDQGQAFDVAVHVGTLTAVVTYYRKDLLIMVRDWLFWLTGKSASNDAKLAWYVILGTIPVGVAGMNLSETLEVELRSPVIIAAATMIFALLLWWAQKSAKEQRVTITLPDAIIIGLFQALALIPGTSRSGITITAGLLTGLHHKQAARFSFLLSIPVIALAGVIKALELFNSSDPVDWYLIAIGASISALVAYLTIGWFLKLLDKLGLTPFVWYRLILGIVLFAVFLG